MKAQENEVLELIHNSGLTRIEDEVVGLLKYSIRLRTHALIESTLEIGASKIGGTPDLPMEMVWPEWNSIPLAFIAQIKLNDISAYDHEGVLPHSGMLYFFYHECDESFSYSLKRYGSPLPWRVLYFDGDTAQLQHASELADLPEENRFAPCAVEFTREITVPPFESPFIKRLGLDYRAFSRGAAPETREEADRYMELTKKMHDLYEAPPIHRLLGYPEPVQGDPFIECQLFSNDLGWAEVQTNRTVASQLERDASDWCLLLQIDSDPAANMMWGDVGTIYFCIKHDDMAKGNFDRAWLVFQCS